MKALVAKVLAVSFWAALSEHAELRTVCKMLCEIHPALSGTVCQQT